MHTINVLPFDLKWVELLGFDVVVNSSCDTPSHYVLGKFSTENTG